MRMYFHFTLLCIPKYILISCLDALVWQITIPVAVCHIINGLWRSMNGTRNTRISSGTSGKIFEIRSRFVLITLNTITQWAIGFIKWFICDPSPNANSKTFRFGMFDIVLPYFGTFIRKSNLFQAIQNMLLTYNKLTTLKYRVSCFLLGKVWKLQRMILDVDPHFPTFSVKWLRDHP